MGSLTDIAFLRAILVEWSALRWDELAFGQREAAALAAAVGLVLALVTLVVRLIRRGTAQRERIALPALLRTFHSSWLHGVRHLPVMLLFLGLPFLLIALADPYTPLIREDVSYPGRRIAILVDSSSSMVESFTAATFEQTDAPVFFTTISAAEYFLQLRMEGRYRDLIALIQFGDEAYVLTPFTTDYENVLLSISLMNDWDEWKRFPAQGTVIINALNVAVGLFKSFDFLEASGNAILIFSDGQDTHVRLEGRDLDEILQEAYDHHIPVYMLRVAADKQLGDVVPDETWRPAVEKTGGKFFPVADEAAMLRAIHEIDQVAGGRVDVRRYAVNRPVFALFAGSALLLWTMALALRLVVPYFSKFP